MAERERVRPVVIGSTAPSAVYAPLYAPEDLAMLSDFQRRFAVERHYDPGMNPVASVNLLGRGYGAQRFNPLHRDMQPVSSGAGGEERKELFCECCGGGCRDNGTVSCPNEEQYDITMPEQGIRGTPRNWGHNEDEEGVAQKCEHCGDWCGGYDSDKPYRPDGSYFGDCWWPRDAIELRVKHMQRLISRQGIDSADSLLLLQRRFMDLLMMPRLVHDTLGQVQMKLESTADFLRTLNDSAMDTQVLPGVERKRQVDSRLTEILPFMLEGVQQSKQNIDLAVERELVHIRGLDKLRWSFDAAVAAGKKFETEARDMGFTGTQSELTAIRWSISEDYRYQEREGHQRRVKEGKQRKAASHKGRQKVHSSGEDSGEEDQRREHSSSSDSSSGRSGPAKRQRPESGRARHAPNYAVRKEQLLLRLNDDRELRILEAVHGRETNRRLRMADHAQGLAEESDLRQEVKASNRVWAERERPDRSRSRSQGRELEERMRRDNQVVDDRIRPKDKG